MRRGEILAPLCKFRHHTFVAGNFRKTDEIPPPT